MESGAAWSRISQESATELWTIKHLLCISFTTIIMSFSIVILVENKLKRLMLGGFLQLGANFCTCRLTISAWFCWQGSDKASAPLTLSSSALLPETAYSDSLEIEVLCLLQKSSHWLLVGGCHSLWVARGPEAELILNTCIASKGFENQSAASSSENVVKQR